MAAIVRPSLPMSDSESLPPLLFDGTTRLYISSICPYAQRVWIARNYKGLNNIELVFISQFNMPSWYREQVYAIGKVPALEHNGKVVGESLDLLEYFERNFDGPPIFPMDAVKHEVAINLLKDSVNLTKAGFIALNIKEPGKADFDGALGTVLDHLEAILTKYSDEGPFFLGQLCVVDFVYAPFLERFQIAFAGIWDYDITEQRPNLSRWFESINQVEAYATTKVHPQDTLELYKKLVEQNHFAKMLRTL